MPRYALLIEYDGAGFCGWQRQLGAPSLQAVLEQAASRLAVGGGAVASVVAGRTDAGVHAAAQVAHLDLEPARSPATLRDALNFHMQPHRIVVLRAATVPGDFSARFSAIGRDYVYRIINRRVRPALLHGSVWHVGHPLDTAAMQAAAQSLLGRHDFTSFRAAACQAASPWRTLDVLDVRRDGEVVEIVASARSFLHHQVRNMVGSLALVGQGRWPPARIAQALAARNRAAAGPTAPAAGLTLAAVRYASDPFA